MFPVSQVVAEWLLPDWQGWVVAEFGKEVVWVPMAHPGRSRALLWVQGAPSTLEEGAGKKQERVTGARERGSMCRWGSCGGVGS